ncbi:hypothetical protein D1136_10155 [Odoribacter sp. Z80]|nr:hypothetical protein [Odoribacter sp. Z80]
MCIFRCRELLKYLQGFKSVKKKR